MYDWADWLEQTDLAIMIRQDLWLYPVIEIIHIIGFVVLVGAALMFDLRILGASVSLSVTKLKDHLLTWSRHGLFLIIPSGFLLFITDAVSLAGNPVFWLKLSLIALGGANAMLFHWIAFKSAKSWDSYQSAPVAAKVNALASIILWLSVICCGRLLAY